MKKYSLTDSEKRKKKVRRIIEEKGMCSLMNTTKWKELKKLVGELPFKPPFVIKDVDEEETAYHRFDMDVRHGGDWGLDLDDHLGGDIYAIPYFAVEWIKVRPRLLQAQGRAVPDKVIDETEEFIEGLKKYSIPYEEINGAIVIYGYR